MIIFLFCGYIGHGKTTAAKFLYHRLCKSGKTLFLGFGDAVKDEISNRFSIERTLMDTQEGKQTIVETDLGNKTIREILVLHSRNMKYLYGDDYYAIKVQKHIIETNPQYVVIHDLRFMEELNTLMKHFTNIITIRIINQNAQIPTCKSEHCIDNLVVNHILRNDKTINYLETSIHQILNSYIGS
jgi:dephospho-CoA kinase